MGTPGFTPPEVDRLTTFRLDAPEASDVLHDLHGITVERGSGNGNLIAVDHDLRAPYCRIKFTGSGGAVALGRNAAVTGSLTLHNESVIMISGYSRVRPLRLKVTLRDRGERVFWCRGASTQGTASSVKGDNATWLVGDDCMFSWGTYLRPFDMHTIVDLDVGEVVNPPRDIIVGPHVWVGQNALVLSGAKIGAGTVVGANSVVTGGQLEPFSIYAGNPARHIRSGISWDRESKQTEESVGRARTIAARYGYSESADS
jgi:acetyltransferase-like isoleucine patch superfamily enzyme